MADIEPQIRAFIVENFLFGEDSGDLTPESSFLESGIIDSTGVLELVGYIEMTYNIKIRDEEIVPENLDSIRRLAMFIQSKPLLLAK